MVSLTSVSERFHIPWTLIAGGTGQVVGTVSETDQTSQPSYVFVRPRHVFRTRFPTSLKAGMVIQSPHGLVFIVGDNGPSELREGVLWQSFRVFEPTGKYLWQRRTTTLDPVTRIETEGTPQTMGVVYAAIETMDRLQLDREMRQNFEQQRFITGSEILPDDIFDNRIVTKVDKQLGLAIGTLT